MDEPVPDLVLADTLWDFENQDRHESLAEFIAAVHCYHVAAKEYAPDVNPDECWQPNVVVLGVAHVIVQFTSEAPGRVDEDCEVKLSSDDGCSFTASELLYKLHNSAVRLLRENHHHWFEGLELSAITDEGTPVYTLRLGS